MEQRSLRKWPKPDQGGPVVSDPSMTLHASTEHTYRRTEAGHLLYIRTSIIQYTNDANDCGMLAQSSVQQHCLGCWQHILYVVQPLVHVVVTKAQ